MLSCKDLSLTRAKRRVISQLSADFEPGQITAIVGPNGAGKSSLLLGLAGLIEADAGEVVLAARPIQSVPPRERARHIGYLPQNAEIAWDIAVENLVALGRQPHGDRAQEPVKKAIAAMELDELRNRPASHLSGGEKARVLLARVLAGEPDWILADEPLAALDLSHQINLIAHLQNAARLGAGVVIVLHDLALAMNHADKVIVLDRGDLVADGPPHEALSNASIDKVWGVRSSWSGQSGQHALSVAKA